MFFFVLYKIETYKTKMFILRRNSFFFNHKKDVHKFGSRFVNSFARLCITSFIEIAKISLDYSSFLNFYKFRRYYVYMYYIYT